MILKENTFVPFRYLVRQKILLNGSLGLVLLQHSMGPVIGISDRDVLRAQDFLGRAFAGADTAGQADQDAGGRRRRGIHQANKSICCCAASVAVGAARAAASPGARKFK